MTYKASDLGIKPTKYNKAFSKANEGNTINFGKALSVLEANSPNSTTRSFIRKSKRRGKC